MTAVTGTSLSAAITTSFGESGANNFSEAMDALKANGSELTMEKLMQIQIKVGVASLAVSLGSAFIKEFTDTAKGVAQKVG